MTIPAPPPPTATDKEWHEWVERHFPFDPDFEFRLRYRTEEQRQLVAGTPEELNDLRGVIDTVKIGEINRTRYVAVILAKLWFSIQAREQRYRSRMVQMPTRQLEQERNEFDEAIGATQTRQRSFGGM